MRRGTPLNLKEALMKANCAALTAAEFPANNL